MTQEGEGHLISARIIVKARIYDPMLGLVLLPPPHHQRHAVELMLSVRHTDLCDNILSIPVQSACTYMRCITHGMQTHKLDKAFRKYFGNDLHALINAQELFFIPFILF